MSTLSLISKHWPSKLIYIAQLYPYIFLIHFLIVGPEPALLFVTFYAPSFSSHFSILLQAFVPNFHKLFLPYFCKPFFPYFSPYIFPIVRPEPAHPFTTHYTVMSCILILYYYRYRLQLRCTRSERSFKYSYTTG